MKRISVSLHKCNICQPPEGDRFLLVMNRVPLHVMHTKQHATSLLKNLKKSNDQPGRYTWEYDIISIKDIEAAHSDPQQPSPVLSELLQELQFPGEHLK